jgi:hypothetical protein
VNGKSNLGASVSARLLNQAKQSGADYQTLLTTYCLERFLYRKIGRQFADGGAVAQRGAAPGHCGRIAQTPAGRNGRSLRWDALGFIVGHASRLILGETASPRNTRTA